MNNQKRGNNEKNDKGEQEISSPIAIFNRNGEHVGRTIQKKFIFDVNPSSSTASIQNDMVHTKNGRFIVFLKMDILGI